MPGTVFTPPRLLRSMCDTDHPMSPTREGKKEYPAAAGEATAAAAAMATTAATKTETGDWRPRAMLVTRRARRAEMRRVGGDGGGAVEYRGPGSTGCQRGV